MRPTLGQKLADLCSAFIGSWKFVGLQTTLLLFWITFNTLAAKKPDPYPFILLNLMLSFSAAYSAPLILMAANRQSEIDRERAIENLNLDRLDHAELLRLSEHLHKHFENKNTNDPG
jgi:uncharacterized membrane protein